MNVIEVEDLRKSFYGRPVLDGISFSIEPGEVFGFLGPNGAGKTTTMRLLLGLLRPDGGKALVFGHPLSDHDQLRQRIGVLLENNGLYERLSCYENLDYMARVYQVGDPESRIEELLTFVGLRGEGDRMVGDLSTGMKRKLGLARAILHDPEVLFFDEPSSGLDPEAQHMVRELILRLSEKRSITVFLNSHNLDEVQRVCSKVAILHHGQIQALDTVRHLTFGTGTTGVQITLADHAQADPAMGIARSCEGVIEVQATGDRLTVTMQGSAVSPLLSRLVQAGIGIEEAVKKSRSLEDIYLDVMKQAGDA